MRAVVYCRVSTVEQTQNLSLETQEKACRDYCARGGYAVDEVFIDAGESAKTTDRPEFLRLLAHCRQRKGHIHAVIVYSLTRFSRNNADHHAIAALLRGFGVMLRSVTEPIDDSPSGRLMEAILAGVAQFDNDVKAERTIAGMKAAVTRGRWVWPAPVGYRNSRAGRGAPSLQPDPVAAPLIRRAFELVAKGKLTGRQLRTHLAGLGLRGKAGQPLAMSRVYGVLRNPVYTGQIVSTRWKESIVGDFAPIVSTELFAQVQQRLSIRGDEAQRATTRHRNHPDFPLRRFVRCATCQKALTGSWSRGRTQRYAHYHCETGCTRIAKGDLEQAFVDLLEQLQPRPEYLRLMRALILERWRAEHDSAAEHRARIQAIVTSTEGKLKRLDDAYIYERRIDDATYRHERDMLREQITLLRLDLHRAEETDVELESLLAEAEHTLGHASALWTSASTTEVRMRIQNTFFPDGLTWKPPAKAQAKRFDVVRRVPSGFGFIEPRTCLQAYHLDQLSEKKIGLVSRVGPTWNHVLGWLEHLKRSMAA